MNGCIILTGYDGTALYIYVAHVVALTPDPNTAGTNIWVGAGEDDAFYAREAPEDVARLIDTAMMSPGAYRISTKAKP